MRSFATAAWLAALMLPASVLSAQDGPATALRITVENENGVPTADVRIIGEGSELLGTTGPDGTATIRYHDRHPAGTTVHVVQIDNLDGRQILLVSEGAAGVDRLKPAVIPQGSGGTRQGLDVLSWQRTPWITVRQRPEWSPPVDANQSSTPTAQTAGPQAARWFAGGGVGRNLELEAFAIGVHFGWFFGAQAWHGLIGNLNLARTGATNGTHWTIAPGVGMMPDLFGSPNPIMTRFIAGLVMDHLSSEFGSGTELGAQFAAGVYYGVSETSVLGAEATLQRVAGFTQFILNFNFLYGPHAIRGGR